MSAEPLAITLLRVAAGRNTLPAARVDKAEADWALHLGLGALLHRAIDGDLERLPEKVAPFVAGAEVTARFRAGELRDATCAILDSSREFVSHVTLLKGISIAEQHYPSPSLRTMCDIDLLVEPGDAPGMRRSLTELGYRPESSDLPESFYETHHHCRPFLHPATAIRVEVHTTLFPGRLEITDRGVFAPASVRSQLRSLPYHGRPAQRLSNELQLVFGAAHWGHDVRLPFVANALLDTIYLLRGSGEDFDWDTVGGWLDEPRVATPLLVLLGYLESRDLIDLDPTFRRALQAAPNSVGRLGTRVMHGFVDQALAGGFGESRFLTDNNVAIAWRAMLCARRPLRNLLSIPYRVLFPPEHPHRYTVRFHLDRLASVWR